MLKIFHLTARGAVGYDSYDSFVAIAENEAKARALCAGLAADEGESTWRLQLHSGCVSIGTARARSKAGIVVASFIAG